MVGPVVMTGGTAGAAVSHGTGRSASASECDSHVVCAGTGADVSRHAVVVSAIPWWAAGPCLESQGRCPLSDPLAARMTVEQLTAVKWRCSGALADRLVLLQVMVWSWRCCATAMPTGMGWLAALRTLSAGTTDTVVSHFSSTTILLPPPASCGRRVATHVEWEGPSAAFPMTASHDLETLRLTGATSCTFGDPVPQRSGRVEKTDVVLAEALAMPRARPLFLPPPRSLVCETTFVCCTDSITAFLPRGTRVAVLRPSKSMGSRFVTAPANRHSGRTSSFSSLGEGNRGTTAATTGFRDVMGAAAVGGAVVVTVFVGAATELAGTRHPVLAAATLMGGTLFTGTAVLLTGMTVLTGVALLTGVAVLMLGVTVLVGVTMAAGATSGATSSGETALTTGSTELASVATVTGATAAMLRLSLVVELQSPWVGRLVSFSGLGVEVDSGTTSEAGEESWRGVWQGDAWRGEEARWGDCDGGLWGDDEESSAVTSGVGGATLTSGVDELTMGGPDGESRGGGCAEGDGTVEVT